LPVQRTPHPPQFNGSLFSLTQALPQHVRPQPQALASQAPPSSPAAPSPPPASALPSPPAESRDPPAPSDEPPSSPPPPTVAVEPLHATTMTHKTPQTGAHRMVHLPSRKTDMLNVQGRAVSCNTNTTKSDVRGVPAWRPIFHRVRQIAILRAARAPC
jgi:hypothetical protein